MLRCITIDELLPGMYVNQVLDDTGKVKVRSKGVVRSEKVIEVLRAKGVERVDIVCSKALAPEENNDAPIDPPTESAEPVKQADKPKPEKQTGLFYLILFIPQLIGEDGHVDATVDGVF